jgi:hypothetical protein
MFSTNDAVSGMERVNYVGGILKLEGALPFRPLAFTGKTTFGLLTHELSMPFRPSLNSRLKTSFYPCGLVSEPDSIVISYGINNEYAGLRKIPHQLVEDAFVNVGA